MVVSVEESSLKYRTQFHVDTTLWRGNISGCVPPPLLFDRRIDIDTDVDKDINIDLGIHMCRKCIGASCGRTAIRITGQFWRRQYMLRVRVPRGSTESLLRWFQTRKV